MKFFVFRSFFLFCCFFSSLAWKAPFVLIFYELRAKLRAESEFDSFRPCVDKTYIFRNSAGKRPLEFFGELFKARRAEYEVVIFESVLDFSVIIFCFRHFCAFFIFVGTGAKEQRKLLIRKIQKMRWANFAQK